MKIGIIGAGNIGGALVRRFKAVGHDVAVANSRGPETLAQLAIETGATAVTVEQAARGRDLVVVTIPQASVPKLPAGLFDGVPASVVVIDTGNYYPTQRDGRIDGIEDGATESRWVSERLGRPVVKAFNNIYAQHLLEHGMPAGTAGRIALPVAGDDVAAKTIVIHLLTRSASMESTPARSTARGVSSPARPSTARTTTGRASQPASPRRGQGGRPSGAPARSVRAPYE